MPRRRWEADRRAALAEHPGGEYLGGDDLVSLPDSHVARCSTVAPPLGFAAAGVRRWHRPARSRATVGIMTTVDGEPDGFETIVALPSGDQPSLCG
jgi:hypothetical protein